MRFLKLNERDAVSGGMGQADAAIGAAAGGAAGAVAGSNAAAAQGGSGVCGAAVGGIAGAAAGAVAGRSCAHGRGGIRRRRRGRDRRCRGRRGGVHGLRTERRHLRVRLWLRLRLWRLRGLWRLWGLRRLRRRRVSSATDRETGLRPPAALFEPEKPIPFRKRGTHAANHH